MFSFENITLEKLDLKILQSDIFNESLSHFFSTRLGGDTPKPLQCFTLSAKDYFEYHNYAQKNLKIACDIINADYEKIFCPNQQHTDNIAIIKNYQETEELKELPLDGIITNLKNFPVCLVFADCVPVLIYDEIKKVLACVHAGWKGTAKRIVPKAVKLMQKEFSCNIENIKVAIGPAICQKCFEVSPDVASQLAMSIETACGNIFLEDEDKVHVDLKLLNKVQLNEIGVEQIDISEYCTCCNNDIFYSYRADNRCTGRHGMVAMIKE